MKITERQKEILEKIVKDYIDLACPISSEFLEQKHHFGVSPATIRIEMQRLTEAGFLYQPHTSAGRVPTDRGYRFFVNKLIEKEFLELEGEFEFEEWFGKEIDNLIKFVQLFTKNLAEISSSLVLSYLPKTNILWKEGWERIFREPEFRETENIFSFTEFISDYEEYMEDFKFDSQIHIFIGKENSFSKQKNFSIISSKCFLFDEEGIISFLGPKRMAYDRNIALLNSFKKVLEKL